MSMVVSVVVPCLNRAELLGPTIDSILNQDYHDVECIVVDGGSVDDSLVILESYGDAIVWVSEPDNGHAAAINKGWRMSQGDILAWLNADDIWETPSAVSKAVDFLNTNPTIDVVYGDCGLIDLEGKPLGMAYSHDWDLNHALRLCDHCIPQPAAFIRRKILEKVGWIDENYISKKDHELWLRIGLEGTIARIPTVLAHERNTPGYLSNRGDITAKACVSLTRKFYAIPKASERVEVSRRLALNGAYVRGMDYAWRDGRHWRTILPFAWAAIMYRPFSAVTVLRRLRWMLARHIALQLR